MRIAVLILAHKNLNQLNKLISHLAEDFDVFVHLDKKSSMKIKELYALKNVFIIKKYRTYWGSFNLIKATLELIKIAFTKKKYDRYIFISGQDVPIKSNYEINKFFKDNNNEYIECNKLPFKKWNMGGLDRVSKYHTISNIGFFGFKKYFFKAVNFLIKLLNSFLKIARKMDYNFYGGTQWFNLSNECMSHILEYLQNNPKYLQRYKFTKCADEIFFQTIIMNLNLMNKIISLSLRYIDWISGPEYPKILRVSDYEKIVKSEMLFARKFDESVDFEVIKHLYAEVQKKLDTNAKTLFRA